MEHPTTNTQNKQLQNSTSKENTHMQNCRRNIKTVVWHKIASYQLHEVVMA